MAWIDSPTSSKFRSDRKEPLPVYCGKGSWLFLYPCAHVRSPWAVWLSPTMPFTHYRKTRITVEKDRKETVLHLNATFRPTSLDGFAKSLWKYLWLEMMGEARAGKIPLLWSWVWYLYSPESHPIWLWCLFAKKKARDSHFPPNHAKANSSLFSVLKWFSRRDICLVTRHEEDQKATFHLSSILAFWFSLF